MVMVRVRRTLIEVLSVTLLSTLLTAAAFADSATASRFQVHGYLTQAFATANYADNGPTSDEVILGIPEDGTTDYRALAIQFRYEISPKDFMVVQFSNRALGDSPVAQIDEDIELDWAFYERRLTDHTSLKVGRIQIPMGIFNEIRDVGTLLPFYRPPSTFYFEGSFTSETVDGISLGHVFKPQSDWSLEATAYLGEWELVEADVFDQNAPPKIAIAEDAFGAQLWLNTPVSGLRFGAGIQQRDVTGGQEGVFRRPGEASRFGDYYLSIDAVLDRFVARAEFRNLGATLVSPILGFEARAFNTIYYAQVGYHFTDAFRVYLQSEFATVEQHSDTFTQDANFDIRTDHGIALNYAFLTGSALVKLEYHMVDAEFAAFQPVFTPSFMLQPIFLEFGDGDYFIASLAVSF